MAWNLGLLGASLPVSAGAFDLLETVTLSTDTATVSFAGLAAYAADYKHLQIRAVGQANLTSQGLHNLFIRLNSDTGSSYSYHQVYSDGVAAQAQGGGSSSFLLCRNPFGSKLDSGIFGSTVIDFLDIHSSSKNTTMRAFGGATQPGESNISLDGGGWYNTAAVTTILLYLNSGSFSTGSRFSLIGIR